MVERITGIPRDQFLKAADLFTSIRKDGDTKKVGTIIYAVGWTQHSFGTQIIRTAAILQLLMGNVGRAGGGVNALRGHSNIQGATDIAGIFDNLPGYLKVPNPADKDFTGWMARITPKAAKPVRLGVVQLLVQYPQVRRLSPQSFVRRRRQERERLGVCVPAKSGSRILLGHIWDDMYRGQVKGLLAFGMNGVAIGPNAQKNIDALKKADWLVVCDIYPDETSDFWRVSGHHARRDEEDQDRGLSPARRGLRREGRHIRQLGSLAAMEVGRSASSRRRQARSGNPGANFPESSRAVPERRRQVPGPHSEPHLELHRSRRIRRLSEVAKEINGRAVGDVTDAASGQTVKAGQQLPGFAWLRDDGSTSCGNWIWCGSWTEAGAMMQRRGTEDPSGLGVYPNWGWSWPMNRRVLYNRASCDLSGKPWDPQRRQVWWNEAQKKWTGNDVPDFKPDSPPRRSHGPVYHEPGRRGTHLRSTGRDGRWSVPRIL